jgi:hypothetical protein
MGGRTRSTLHGATSHRDLPSVLKDMSAFRSNLNMPPSKRNSSKEISDLFQSLTCCPRSLLKIPSDRKNAIQADCDVFLETPDPHREEPACSLLQAGEADWRRMCSSRRRPRLMRRGRSGRASVAVRRARFSRASCEWSRKRARKSRRMTRRMDTGESPWVSWPTGQDEVGSMPVRRRKAKQEKGGGIFR